MSAEHIIIKKLNSFISKYYRFETIKGLILMFLVSLSLFLLFISIDYLWQLNSVGRTVLFYVWLSASVFCFVWFVCVPLLKMFHVAHGISNEQAAEIIGTHFPDINDKLLNTIQLITFSSHQDNQLLLASIEQRSESLKPIPFNIAVDFSKILTVGKWLLIPASVFLILWFTIPSLIETSTKRIVNYSEEFTPQAPFVLNVDYNQSVFRFEDLPVSINISGDFLPSEVYIAYNGLNYLCTQSQNQFNYTLKQVKENGSFSIVANGFTFGPYDISTLVKPSINAIRLTANYPNYLNKQNEVFKNLSGVEVPEGTRLNWKLNLQHADSFYFSGNGISANFKKGNSINSTARKTFNYNYSAFTNEIFTDTISQWLSVVKDRYPIINIKQQADSLMPTEFLFTGTISDDYGFTKFLVGLSENNAFTPIDTLSFLQNIQEQNFYHSFSLANYLDKEKVTVQFVVWDNDGVNGAKKTTSNLFSIKVPGKADLVKQKSETVNDIVDEMKQAVKNTDKLQKEWKQFSDELKNKTKTDWQDKKRLEELLEQQKQVQNQLENIQDKKLQKDALENLTPQQKEDIIKKQEAVNELFEDLMSEEMKQMMEEIEKLMQELNKEELQQNLENFEMNTEQLNQELDRTLEVFKQLELEKLVNETSEQIEELAKKQEELAKKSEEKGADSENLKQEQDKLNQEFDKLKEQLSDIDKKNEELSSPQDLPNTEEQQESISEEMENASESLDKNNKKNAGKQQKNAAEQMQQMANNLMQSMQKSGEEQMEEDMVALRALLENIIHLSFDQESAMETLKTLNTNDPTYLEINRQQRQFKENSFIIQDSLFALSKRVPQISNIVNKEISSINHNMGKAIAAMAEVQTPQALSNQQYAMTSLNNLALLLDEALKAMQQQSANSMPGKANCNKPGQGKKPNSAKMSEMQKAMAKQLDALKKAMQEGKKPGAGKGGKNGKSGLSKELAKIAAEQSAIREEINKLSKELENGKDGVGKSLKEIAKDMDKLEEEIAKKNISPELIKRQQDIMTRLLKAENAERVREMDNKRESKSAKNNPKGNLTDYLEYKRKKKQEQELLKTLPPDLKPFYKTKINTYFNQLNN